MNKRRIAILGPIGSIGTQTLDVIRQHRDLFEVELISGKKPSTKFLLVTQLIGMTLLILLMFLAFGNDISRIIR